MIINLKHTECLKNNFTNYGNGFNTKTSKYPHNTSKRGPIPWLARSPYLSCLDSHLRIHLHLFMLHTASRISAAQINYCNYRNKQTFKGLRSGERKDSGNGTHFPLHI